MSASDTLPEHGARRVVIENVRPRIDGGRFPIKRVTGESVVVDADVFADGHDAVSGALEYRSGDGPWERVPLAPLGNDRWRGEFTVGAPGECEYTVLGWVDHLKTWRGDIAKKYAAEQDVSVDLQQGAALVRAAAARAGGADRERLAAWAEALERATSDLATRFGASQDPALHALAWWYPQPEQVLRLEPPLRVSVDRVRARYSTWYELFPRSTAPAAGAHGTLRDTASRLADIAAMGFDVVYLPPIHPIGTTERKGPNNRPGASPTDPGSPWAIGARAGGHTAIHPELGSLEDFGALVARARELGLEIALDLAFQSSPDHPYVSEHPEWFRHRPDGSIQYAENPPKKYQDIYPFDFESTAWRELWEELARVVEFWVSQGVRIFRVDNPHTKPFALWEWLIGRVRARHPEVLFLAEAFTRPKVMYRLAKLGFSQSYTYFSWRNTRDELASYFRELTTAPVADFFRPNLWPNTPDILTEYLQFGGRPAFTVRLVLAATLAASYGIYGPAFELMEHEPREPGGEEYRDSEKYQLRHWDRERPESLRDLVARVNHIRRDNPALQSDRSLAFHQTDNETLIAYSKSTADHADTIIVVANLDPHNVQSGWVELDLQAIGALPQQSFQVHDLLSGSRFLWRGARNFVRLAPHSAPAHILRVRRRVRTERDFDYFL
jgi:starch synthase (maltosyl-transferring)